MIRNRHVRYPWHDESRAVITDLDASIEDLFVDDPQAVVHGYRRVEKALTEGEIPEPTLDAERSLFGYPLARVLVSLLAGRTDAPGTILDAYAGGEARTFRERLTTDVRDEDAIDVAWISSSLDVEIWQDEDGYVLPVAEYLGSDATGDLTSKNPTKGEVRVSDAELYDVLESAVFDAVRADLPYEVPERIADPAQEAVADLEALLASERPPRSFEVVRPGAMPPCLSALLSDARDGASLEPPGEFALVSFLASAGMDAQAINDLTGGGLDPTRVAYHRERIATDDGLLVGPVTCAGMEDYGLCTEPDETCEEVESPASYYDESV